jgi:hypothetical protein
MSSPKKGYVPKSALVQQNRQQDKKSLANVVNKQVAKKMAKSFGENEPVYSDRGPGYALTVTRIPGQSYTQETLRGSTPSPIGPIGAGYMSDCGMYVRWVYKCPPRNGPPCIENLSDGAWVPFITLYQTEYFLCKEIKEGDGREFSNAHGQAYK